MEKERSELFLKRNKKNLLFSHPFCPIKKGRKGLREEGEEGLKEICLEMEKC